MPAPFENGENCDGSNIWASVHTMPEQLKKNGRKSDGKKTRCKTLMPKRCTHALRIDQSRSKSVDKCSAFVIFECSHDAVSKMCRSAFRFKNLPRVAKSPLPSSKPGFQGPTFPISLFSENLDKKILFISSKVLIDLFMIYQHFYICHL